MPSSIPDISSTFVCICTLSCEDPSPHRGAPYAPPFFVHMIGDLQVHRCCLLSSGLLPSTGHPRLLYMDILDNDDFVQSKMGIDLTVKSVANCPSIPRIRCIDKTLRYIMDIPLLLSPK